MEALASFFEDDTSAVTVPQLAASTLTSF